MDAVAQLEAQFVLVEVLQNRAMGALGLPKQACSHSVLLLNMEIVR